MGYPLRGRLAGLWSYRVGAYRIIYEQRDDRTVRVALSVVAIRHRGQGLHHRPQMTTGDPLGFRP
ncbi:hypothetical protein BH23ACT9_BH23ACT9_38800 [soil metagenome]